MTFVGGNWVKLNHHVIFNWYMNNLKLYLFGFAVLSFTFFSTGCSVSNRAKLANEAYSNFLYNDAIEGYESILPQKRDNDMLRKLADSYRLVGNSHKAEYYYEQLEKNQGASNIDILHYAEVLKMNGNYNLAIAKMEKYNVSVQGDVRVEQHILDKGYYVPLLEDKGQFILTNLKLNSAESDFGTAYLNNQVVYATSRRDWGFTNYEYNWNLKNFLNLYTFEKDTSDRSKVKKVKAFTVKGGLNKKYHEGPATFSKSGSLMIFTRDRYAKTQDLNKDQVRVLELWYSEKDAKGNWLKPQPMSFNNKEYSVGHAAITPDGNTLYFVSDMPGGFGSSDIYFSTKMGDGSWSTPVNAGPSVNTEGKEMFPFYHEKGILFFSSDGHAGLGGLDVFMTKVKDNSFGVVKNLGSKLNSSKDDFAFIIDTDMKTGYLSSDRDGGKGNDDIYSFDLLIPFKLSKRLEGIVRDKENNLGLPFSTVKLYSSDNILIAESITDENGNYSFDLDPDSDYYLISNKDNYAEGRNVISSKTEDELISVDIQLEKIPEIGLLCFVSDNKTGTPIEGAHILIKDKRSGNIIADVSTDKEGYWQKLLNGAKINDLLTYDITLSKEGYVEKTMEFSYTITKEGLVKIHEKLDLTLGKIELGTDLGQLIDIMPIYFDLGDYVIRPDAAKELDKIVSIMNKYPSIVIELGSHTDCRSSYSSNEKLSDKRAKASANYIINQGISSDRIYGKGYGERELLNDCRCEGNVKSTCSEEEHQKNRRTVFKIVKIMEQGVNTK